MVCTGKISNLESGRAGNYTHGVPWAELEKRVMQREVQRT